MTVDEMYDQNERVKPLIDQLEHKEALNNQTETSLSDSNENKSQTNDQTTKTDSQAASSKSLPSRTAAEFLKAEGSARMFTVPQLTATHGDASDDVFLCFF